MNLLLKLFIDYLRSRISSVVAGRKNYDAWKKKNYSLRTVLLKNKKLAQELEKACDKDGFLTYSEYLAIDQFGKNGYHSQHSRYGMTDSHLHWEQPLARFCQEHEVSSIIEFGPGDGSLGIGVLKNLKQNSVVWNAIEINTTLQEKIVNRFKKEKLHSHLGTITSSITNISIPKKCLVVFSYSLDSIPPNIFINTTNNKSFPNALIGVIVKDGLLKEIILSKKELLLKKTALDGGIYKDDLGVSYNIGSWEIYPGQRAYLSVKSLSTFASLVTKAKKDTIFLIIDEFHGQPTPWETGHFLLPRNLYLYKRDIVNLDKAYQEAGDNLLYYPIYFYTFLKFCHSLGFNSTTYDIEQKLARELEGKSWIPKKSYYTTYAFITSKKEREIPSIIPIQFPKTTLV